jgi:amino acid transporter
VDYVVFADWIFFGLAGLSLFVFRRRIPLAERSSGTFATPGYPWVPAVFTAVALLIVLSSFWRDPLGSALGVILLATGIPAFIFWKNRYGKDS